MATEHLQLGYGSDGTYVQKLQEKLNQNGYDLVVDGDFGPKTLSAVKDYQKKHNLTVDGVVGKDTWGSLNIGTSAVKPATPTTGNEAVGATKPAAADQSYQQSETVTQAQALLQQMMQNKPGAYESQWQEQINGLMDQILNREDFSYDLNADALYQQYADQYRTQGKLAMMDTMGQAQAMTGGYGNSYAQAVGQQAYQGYLQQLNEVVPELYGMAYDQYQQEGQNLLNQYGLVASQDEQEYGRYRDEVADYQNRLQQAYSQFVNERDFDYGQFSDDRAYGYQSERDAVADQQWQKEYEESVRQYDEQMGLAKDKWDWEKAQYEKSSGSDDTDNTGGNDKPGNNPVSNPNNQVKDNNDTKKTEVSDAVRSKLEGFKSNSAVEKYLENLEASGTIDHETALQLMSEYMDHNEVYKENKDGSKSISYGDMIKSTSGWKVVDDGGTNWFWGVDNNAIVEAPNGEQIRLDNLVDKLVSEGMSKSDAKSFVKKLQKNLDI